MDDITWIYIDYNIDTQKTKKKKNSLSPLVLSLTLPLPKGWPESLFLCVERVRR